MTIDKTLLLGLIMELCAGEGDLDLIFKLLATNAESIEAAR